MQQRWHFEQLLALTEPLDEEAFRLRARSEQLPHGAERDMVARTARQLKTATHVDEWLSSHGLQSPR